MRKGKSIMGNSILPILPAIHATILSIIFAVLIVFFFYSYQTVSNLKDQLNDLRTEVAQSMRGQICSPLKFELEEYFKDDTLNHLNIMKKLGEISSVMGSIEITKTAPPHPRMDEDYIEKSIIESSEQLLGLITVFTYIYPYCERPKNEKGVPTGISNIMRKEYTPEWKNDLVRLNSYLSWFWRTRGEGITKLISEYDKIFAKKHTTQTFRLNFSRSVEDFFSQVQFIETKIIPELSEKSYKLNFYEKRFRIKTHLVSAFILAITMLIVGVFLPLFIHLYIQHPQIKQIELVFLIITVLPYLCILLYYLKKTLELKLI
ncbi:hypothetical protein GWN26_14070 [Candidatus Saccharibacteria bacterium]|nr:hypothetical protein [Candidatus Saccharibacteria bacterium]NIW80525.1 hypothetical protein [Calditrichia bacterium]